MTHSQIIMWGWTVLFALIGGSIFGFKMGKRYGQRLEVRTMIEILDALKVDNWEHTVFRDRFKSALEWALDGKRKGDRDGKKKE